MEQSVGLKVNYDKTTIYRMGSIAHSNAKIYTISAFQWINIPPNILGVDIVRYDGNDATASNFKNVFERARAIIDNWKNRNISLSGKVLIVNTLIASLFVYKMAVLPNILYHLIQQFENMIDNYLGNSRKCRIPLSVLKLPRNEGGLQLVDLFKRQMSLKAQWVITIRDNPDWAAIAYQHLDPVISEVIWKCNLQADDIAPLFPGSFWKQVLYAWALVNTQNSDTDERIAGQILWYNSYIKVNDVVLINHAAFKNNLIYVKNLFNDQGMLYTYNELVAIYGNCITWLQHMQLIAALPHHWKQYLISNPIMQIDTGTFYEQVINESKITNIVYNKLITESEYLDKPRMKWQTRLEEPVYQEEFVDVFKNINRVTISTKLRDFQYRLLHNALVTNHQLCLWKIIPTDRCTFCQNQKEHTVHLFVDCNYVSKLWEQLRLWLHDELGLTHISDLNWSTRNIMFNMVHPIANHVINFLILITKQYIYKQRCLTQKLNIEQLIYEIEMVQKIEYNLAFEGGRLAKHYNKWCKIYPKMEMQEYEIQSQNAYVNQYVQAM